MTRVRKHLSYANVMATIAVFLALGGVTYAALKLPKNSVGSKQVKTGAITRSKIRARAVNGSKVANGSISGRDLARGTRTGFLRSGETITGQLMIENRASGMNQPFGAFGSFPLRPPNPIPQSRQHIVTGASGPGCPGAGRAAAGQFCLYQTATTNVSGTPAAALFDPAGQNGPFTWGFGLDVLSAGTGQVFFAATWAYHQR